MRSIVIFFVSVVIASRVSSVPLDCFEEHKECNKNYVQEAHKNNSTQADRCKAFGRYKNCLLVTECYYGQYKANSDMAYVLCSSRGGFSVVAYSEICLFFSMLLVILCQRRGLPF
ncbi:hypothetical protein SNE40_008888 [Patella caerulea]|uniref:Uncharacterized protein n=1 Tax=Patella caerulea TaxID=87958 RepID=A0AAN8JW54_PATCE